MALKVLQITGAAAVVVIVILMIPVLLRLRRTLDEVGGIVAETRPQTVMLLKKAQGTLDSVNRELETIESITEDANVLIGKVGEASDAVERAITSPMTRYGFITAGVTAAGFAVKRRVARELRARK